jgi:hypothetical protein
MDIGLHVAEVESVHGLAVRPDVLLIAVSARVEDVSATQALSLLRQAASKLQSKALEVHRDAELSPRRLDFGRNMADKASKVSDADAQIDGILHIPLEESLDYWARAELVAKITEALRSFTWEMYKAKPSIRFGFRPPVPRVRDVAVHKRELSTRYAAQWRALTGSGEKVPTAGTWEIPDEVAQYAVSLEEVRLALVPARKYPQSRET